jgi:hypothetical protein
MLRTVYGFFTHRQPACNENALSFSSSLRLCLSLIIAIAPQAQADTPKPTLKPAVERTYRFALNDSTLDRGTPQYFSLFIPKAENPEQHAAFRDSVALDFPGYYRNRGNDDYAIMLGRVVFTVDRPVSAYTRNRLLDVQRMNRLIPEFPSRRATQEGPGVFLSDGNPSCKFKIEIFTRDELLALGGSRPELRYPETIHPELGVPEVISLQHNYDFGRMLGFKTSRGAITLTAHYARGPRQTLVSTVSLSYLENTPPAIWGGAQLVMDTSRDATLLLVERLRKETF